MYYNSLVIFFKLSMICFRCFMQLSQIGKPVMPFSLVIWMSKTLDVLAGFRSSQQKGGSLN